MFTTSTPNNMPDPYDDYLRGGYNENDHGSISDCEKTRTDVRERLRLYLQRERLRLQPISSCPQEPFILSRLVCSSTGRSAGVDTARARAVRRGNYYYSTPALLGAVRARISTALHGDDVVGIGEPGADYVPVDHDEPGPRLVVRRDVVVGCIGEPSRRNWSRRRCDGELPKRRSAGTSRSGAPL